MRRNRALPMVPVVSLAAALLLEAQIDGTGIGLVRLGVPIMFIAIVRDQRALLVGLLTAENMLGHLLASRTLEFAIPATLGDLVAVLVAVGVHRAWRSWDGGIETPMGYLRAAGSMTLGSAVGAVGWWMTLAPGVSLPVDVVTADMLGVVVVAPMVSWSRGWPGRHPHLVEGMLAASLYAFIAWANLFPPISRAGRHMLQSVALVAIAWMVLRAGRRFTAAGWLGATVCIWIGLEQGLTLLGHENLTFEEAMLTTRVTLMGLGIVVFSGVFGMLGYQNLVRASRVGEARARALAEAAPDAMIVIGGRGEIRFASTAAVAMLGELVGEQAAERLPWLSSLIDDIHPGACTEVAATLPNGASFPAEITAARHEDVDGSSLIALAIRDVSVRVAQQKELERFAGDLARTNRDLAQFAYAASHDLQEPLRTVASYVHLLQHKYAMQLDEAAGEYIGLATEGAERLQALVADLLEYSTAANVELGDRPIALDGVVEHAAMLLAEPIEARGAAISVESLPSLHGDRAALCRVFQNLLSNAIKFTPEDRRPEIRVWSEASSEGVIVKVSDNGIGIPEEHRERVLEPFRRLHARHRYPGTGLGLAMARRFIERHGGRIWIEGSSEGGTTVCFTLRSALRRIA